MIRGDHGSHHFLAPANDAPHLLLEPRLVLAPLLCGVDVRGALVVRRAEHGNNGHKNRLYRVDGAPPIGAVLVSVGIVSRLVEDGDAHPAVLVHVRVPHLRREHDRGGGVGVVVAEGHQGLEETTIIERIWWANDRDLPLEDVAVVDQTRAETVHGLLGELCA